MLAAAQCLLGRMNTQATATDDAVYNPQLFRFPAVKKRQVAASFSGGDVTSDGGLRLGLRPVRHQVSWFLAFAAGCP